MKMKAKITCCVVFWIMVWGPGSGVCYAQDIHFSQYYMNPLALSPANAGVERTKLQAIAVYKDQWKSVASPYKTLSLSCDKKLNLSFSRLDFLALGVNVFNDKAGDINMKTFQAGVSVAYHRFLNRQKYMSVGLGLQSGFAQRSITLENATWGNQYDGNSFNPLLSSGEPEGSSSFSYADPLSAGVVWAYNNTSGRLKVTDNHDMKVVIGFGVYHLLRPDYSFYGTQEKLNVKYVLNGSSMLSIPNSNIAVAPGFLFYRQGPARELYPGTLIRYKLKQASKYTGYFKSTALSVGGFLRVKDAVAAVLQFEHAGYCMGISYDFNISDLRVASSGRGGIEIALRYNIEEQYGGRSKF